MAKKQITIPVFVPHAGCRHSCVFCNQWRVSGSDRVSDAADIERIAETYLSTRTDSVTRVEIAFFGGSFTGIEPERQRRLLDAAESLIERGIAHSIRLSTRPDYIDSERLAMLKHYSVETVELGVQSLDAEVLAASGRGHTPEDVYRAVGLLKVYGFRTGIQLMPGLPSDTFEKSMNSAEKAVSLKPHDARIYPCVVLAGTELEQMYNEGRFNPLTLEQAIDISSRMYRMFHENSINVIRIGLHPVDAGNETVVAGPYHTSMGFLVKSRYRRDLLEELMVSSNLLHPGTRRIKLMIPTGFAEEYIGMKRENISYLKTKFYLDKLEYEIAPIPRPELVV